MILSWFDWRWSHDIPISDSLSVYLIGPLLALSWMLWQLNIELWLNAVPLNQESTAVPLAKPIWSGVFIDYERTKCRIEGAEIVLTLPYEVFNHDEELNPACLPRCMQLLAKSLKCNREEIKCNFSVQFQFTIICVIILRFRWFWPASVILWLWCEKLDVQDSSIKLDNAVLPLLPFCLCYLVRGHL